MKKNIHPKTRPVTYKCATCGASFVIETTSPTEVVNLDVCSNCHPLYKGKLEVKTKVANPKLNEMFAKGKANASKKG